MDRASAGRTHSAAAVVFAVVLIVAALAAMAVSLRLFAGEDPAMQGTAWLLWLVGVVTLAGCGSSSAR